MREMIHARPPITTSVANSETAKLLHMPPAIIASLPTVQMPSPPSQRRKRLAERVKPRQLRLGSSCLDRPQGP